jgi:hypothetical protein
MANFLFQSKKYQVLVDRAEKFLPLLPWPKEFEKDKFLRPGANAINMKQSLNDTTLLRLILHIVLKAG